MGIRFLRLPHSMLTLFQLSFQIETIASKYLVEAQPHYNCNSLDLTHAMSIAAGNRDDLPTLRVTKHFCKKLKKTILKSCSGGEETGRLMFTRASC